MTSLRLQVSENLDWEDACRRAAILLDEVSEKYAKLTGETTEMATRRGRSTTRYGITALYAAEKSTSSRARTATWP